MVMLLPIAMGLAGFTAAAPLFGVAVSKCEADYLTYLTTTGQWPVYIGITNYPGNTFVFSSSVVRDAMRAEMERLGCTTKLTADITIIPSTSIDCPSCVSSGGNNLFGSEQASAKKVPVQRIKCSEQTPCLCPQVHLLACPEYEYVFGVLRCTFEGGCYHAEDLQRDIALSILNDAKRSMISEVGYNYIGRISDSCDLLQVPPSSAVPAGASIDILSCPDDDDNIIVWIVVPIGIVAVVGGIAYWYFRCRGKNDSDNTVLVRNLL